MYVYLLDVYSFLLFSVFINIIVVHLFQLQMTDDICYFYTIHEYIHKISEIHLTFYLLFDTDM